METGETTRYRQLAKTWLTPSPNTVIIQPTTFCPMDCGYCYLPNRHRKKDMSASTAEAIVQGMADYWFTGKPVEVVWHGGEPLAVGVDKFEELLQPFEPLRAAGKIVQRVQTGAILITDAWCDLFKRYEIDVGVSIDGPEHTNRNRVDRGGRPTFDRAVKGIEKLKEHGLPFTTLAVVTIEGTTRAVETLDFFAELGCHWVGLNIEAKEAANVNGITPEIDQAQRFWRDAFEWAAEHPEVTIRDVDSLAKFLSYDADLRTVDGRHDLIPTISWDGKVVLLSPELLGVHDARHNDFVVGNVVDTPLSALLADVTTVPYVREFLDGLNACKQSCQFWNYCQGAHAGDRYFEHGSFAATETSHCQVAFQAPALALAELLREG
ncbi:cyclophane-forming radical SAM peptide maturase AmcB [Actinokineospora enzanensis]|uniref:cyclophane-forming radical SAM peptide maturase AmcB n=1 Tax=Actinokineospora enzanensis TaxID=155975 RepID=UPI0007C59A36|nr:cyclophane-forming radical SAM peptide maturase AmcB [Actinokineospora enzanensis]